MITNVLTEEDIHSLEMKNSSSCQSLKFARILMCVIPLALLHFVN